MTMQANSGIYAITHKFSGKCYIGSSKNTKHRMSVHRSNLRGGTHVNKFLQSAWDKHGESSFVFNKMISCDVKNLIHFEQMMMDVQQSYDKRFGYNLKPKAESTVGYKHPEGWVSPMKGRPSPMKGIPKTYPSWNKGKKLPPEQIEKLRLSNLGRIPWNKGVPASDETKKKLSTSLKGRKAWNKDHAMSEESKVKLSASQKKRLSTPEAREIQRKAKLGKKCAPYTGGNAVKTHCPSGHPYSGDNLYIHPSANRRGCKACIKIQTQKAKNKKDGVS